MKFHNTIVQTHYLSPLGPVTIAASNQGLAGLWFEGQRHLPIELTGPAVWAQAPEHPVLTQASQQLADYFAGHRLAFDLPLDLSYGTPFQQAVWEALRAIPLGKTLSYGAVSNQIGKPAAVRAVGAAIGRNPVSIIVPCHRVIGSQGMLTGYAGGLDRKTALLTLEGVFQESLL
jgi:methylated-DNA-[protein]-cysteine S-methyltransferase